MTQPEPSVCIVATVRNERATINAFVDSLLKQTAKPGEIIIVDGLSTDGTLEILKTYEANGHLRVISRDCNIAAGRNIGIAAASADIICITDAGCKVEPDWVEQLVACFEHTPETDVVAGNFRFETCSAFEKAVVLATFPPNRDDLDAARYFPSSRSLAFRKSAWARAGGYPEWLYAAEDTLFNLRLRQIGCHFEFGRRAIVRWRPRENWRALARQRFNFSRGNARVGIGLDGYRMTLRTHALVLACLLVAPWFWPTGLASIALFAQHVRRNLLPQARSASKGQAATCLRVLAVMEFVRVVNIAGFLRGRLDRKVDRRFVDEQMKYMGTSSADDLIF